MSGIQNFLNAVENYEELKGQQTNLYKCFIPLVYMIGNNNAISALLHPDSVYDDPVDHHTQFSINVYGGPQDKVKFDAIFNLYDPITVEACYDSNNSDETELGIKDNSGA